MIFSHKHVPRINVVVRSYSHPNKTHVGSKLLFTYEHTRMSPGPHSTFQPNARERVVTVVVFTFAVDDRTGGDADAREAVGASLARRVEQRRVHAYKRRDNNCWTEKRAREARQLWSYQEVIRTDIFSKSLFPQNRGSTSGHLGASQLIRVARQISNEV